MVEKINYSALRLDAIGSIERAFKKRELLNDADELEKAVDRLVQDFHTLAVAALLLDGDPAKFQLNLLRAAENRRGHLVHCSKRRFAFPRSSRLEALLGAVLAEAWPLAESMVGHWESVGRAPLEYLDEFL